MGRQQGIKLIKRKNSQNWYVEGTLFKRRIRKSTGTASREEATLILNDVISQIRRQHLYGEEVAIIPDFNTMAAKYLREATKSSIKEDARHIKHLSEYIGELSMMEIFRGFDSTGNPSSLEQFILDRAGKGLSIRTINYPLQVLNIIGNKSAKRWRNSAGEPMIPYWNCVYLVNKEEGKALGLKPKKIPYPLSWEEQDAFLDELPLHLKRMFLFKVNSGCREQEVCKLRWKWLKKHNKEIWYFVIPSEFVKNRMERVVVLNNIAKEVISKQEGQNPDFVFTFKGHPVGRINNSAFRKARKRVSTQFPDLINAGVHSLKHTYGARLRAAGVPEEDRNFLTGHKGKMSMTTHYSVPELCKMLEYSNRVCDRKNRLILVKGKVA